MTRGTALELAKAWNIIFSRQAFPDFRLIRRGLPIHIENLVARPQHRFRIAVAIQAPMHQQRAGLKHQGHLVYLAVAGRAANAFVNVNAVIEINVVRQPMYAHPFNRFIGSIAFPNGLEISGIVEQNRMAVHARFRRRNSRGGGGLNRGMTIAAIDTIIADVMFVAELNRLLAGDVLVRQIGSARQTHDGAKPQGSEQRAKKDTDLGDKIRAAVKNLSHVNVALLR